jgi:DNA-binding beta-propeller fold protein YncE
LVIGHHFASDGTGGQAQFGKVAGIAIAASGDIYVADADGETIRRISAGAVVTTVAGTPLMSGSADGVGGAARFSNPGAVAFDGRGILYIADRGNHSIRRLLPGDTVDTLVGSSARVGTRLGPLPSTLDDPQGIAIRSDGQLAIAVDSAVLVTRDL